VTCSIDSGIVSIRAQSNNMPNNCFSTKGQTQIPNYFQVDFQVLWNTKIGPFTQAEQLFATPASTTTTLCDVTRTAQVNIAAA
jgi:hypothetical protein